MGYPYEVYRIAKEQLAAKKRNAEETAMLHKQDFTAAEPIYSELVRSLSTTASKTAKIILSGEREKLEQLEIMRRESAFIRTQTENLLAAHGLPADYLETKYSCNKCKDTGYVDGFMCDCLKKLARDIACKQLNELSPLSLSSFEDLKLNYYPESSDSSKISPRKRMENIILYCRKYADDFSPYSDSLMFIGATGLGKTHISLAIANVVTQKGYGVVYGSVQSFMSRLEQEHFGKQNAKNVCRNMLVECDLLILDDLGSEFSTPFTVAALYDIINARMATGKPTVLNTNLSLGEIEARYTERVVSRLAGYYKIFRFDGKDIRTMRNAN